jgi:regulator of cell morphogenesis and NO signaling
MEAFEERTIGEIVAEDYRTAGVFKKFGLDFCCGGSTLVREACHNKGIEIDKLIDELQAATTEGDDSHNYNEWSPELLIDYIEQRHHQFVRTKLPEIETYAKKVAKVHGSRHEELDEIRDEFLNLKDDMLSHLEKEEQMLFPYIKELVGRVNAGEKQQERPTFGAVENPVRLMEIEHDEAGDAMEKIQQLSNNFTPPEDACATYRVLFQNLKGFQEDLHKHVHLENNILFPKALDLEKRLN